jgi:hypothetical protein
MIHAANMILLLQRLIPEDVDTNISFAFDHLITTYYATAYKFAWMITEKTTNHYYDTKKISMIPTRTAIVVAVNHLLLDLHSHFGMVLPICNVMEESCPSVYMLLTPNEKESEKYSKLKWIKRDITFLHVDKAENEKGWSNIPFLFWVVGFLVENAHVTLKVQGKRHPKGKGSKSVNDYLPLMKYGGKITTLAGFIEFLLFPYLQQDDPGLSDFLKQVEQALQGVTKEIVYSEIQKSFDGTKCLYGALLKKQPAVRKGKKRKAANEASEEDDPTTGTVNQEKQKMAKKKKVILDDSNDNAEDNGGPKAVENKLHQSENMLEDLEEVFTFTGDVDNFVDASLYDEGNGVLPGVASGVGDVEDAGGDDCDDQREDKDDTENSEEGEEEEVEEEEEEEENDISEGIVASHNDDEKLEKEKIENSPGNDEENENTSRDDNVEINNKEREIVDRENKKDEQEVLLVAMEKRKQEVEQEKRKRTSTEGSDDNHIEPDLLSIDGEKTKAIEPSIDSLAEEGSLHKDNHATDKGRSPQTIPESERPTDNQKEGEMEIPKETRQDGSHGETGLEEIEDGTRKRKETEVKQVTTSTRNNDLEDSTVSVPKIHPNLPPEYIKLSVTPWYWDLPIRDITVENLTERIGTNLAKLRYNMFAIVYAEHKKKTSGVPLLNILTSPSCTRELHASWPATLQCLEDWCMHLAKFGGTLRELDVKPNDGQSFLEYMRFVLGEENPSNIGESLLMHYWQRKDVVDVKKFNIDTVLSTMHTLKCCILFDTICRSCYKPHLMSPLKTVLFGAGGGLKHFKRHTTAERTAWEQRFNLTVHCLKEIVVYKKDVATLMEDYKYDYFQCLVGETKKLLAGVSLQNLQTTNDPVVAECTAADIVPRPSFLELKLDESKNKLFDMLQGLYFDGDGCLRRDLEENVSFGPPHGLIRFGGYHLGDVRYFIPLKRLAKESKGKCCL